MADDTAHVSKKLDEMRRQAAMKLEEARAIVSSMNTVEAVFDLPLTVLADLPSAAPAVPPNGGTTRAAEGRSGVPQKGRSLQSIRPDEYFGDEPLTAAKKYITSVGHAVQFDEITDAVQRGGAAIQGADWRDRLEISLKRSPYEVITVADKTYGLSGFYTAEQLKRFRGSRRGEVRPAVKKKARGRGKPKTASKKGEAKVPKTSAPESKKGAGHNPAAEDPHHGHSGADGKVG